MRRNPPEIYQSVYEKAMSGNSRQSAIKAFCLECCHWEYNEVAACTDDGCPLYPYRPYKAETPPLNGGVLSAESKKAL